MTHWYVGQKVQCVTASWERSCDPNQPVKGEVYTIEHIEERQQNNPAFDNIGFLLLEVTNPPRWMGGSFEEIAFHHSGFRPLVDTNISVFEKMLKKKSRKKSAPTHKQVRETV